MAVQTTKTNKPFNPRGNDQSPKGYNRASLFSGKALDFDGVNDQITFGTISDLTFGTGDFSAVLDWQIDSVSTYSWAIAKNPATDFGIGINETGGLLRLWIGGTLSLGTENILGSDWKKIAVVRESGVVSAYINGVAISLTETAMAGSIDSGDLIVGSWVSNADFWNGLLNNIRLFNTALTAAQVADLYNNPEKVVPTGVDNTALKLWLPMMEGAGTTSYDGSGNGNHGTISGATYVNGVGAPVSQTAVIDWNKGANILPYSEELNQWGKQVVSVSQSSATAPDGSTNAYDLTDADSGQYGILVPGLSVAMAGDYVGSLFVKKTTGALSHYPGFDIGQPGAYVIIDTTNGTTATAGTGGVYSDVTITSHNDDWWRVSAKATINSTSKPMRIWPAISENGTGVSVSATGTNTFWGAQVEQADAIGPYVRTGATAQTSPVLLPQGLTSGRDITGVNLFENVRKQGALNLDGNSWAEVHDNESLDITGHITLEAWVQIKDGMASDGVLGRWAASLGYLLYLNASNDIRFYVNGLDTRYTGLTNGWHHIVGLYDGSAKKLYVDGAEVSSSSQSVGAAASTAPIEIGRYQQSTGNTFDGPIAQPRIYNRALTAAEVLQNYNSGKNTYK